MSQQEISVINLDQLVSMTSVEIAELTGKEHRNVLRDIRNMAEELNALKTEQSYRGDPRPPSSLASGRTSKMTMSQLEALPIVIEGHSFICNDQRMWNLNEIHRVLGLPASKMPSEWNNKIRTQLDRSGNFRTVWKLGRILFVTTTLCPVLKMNWMVKM